MLGETVGIFVATMTGTAEICAEEVAAALRNAGLNPEIRMMDGLGTDALRPFDLVVIVSSTYGHGDIPDNGQELFARIQAADNLTGMRYAVFGLGDRTYGATFCEAGRKWDGLLAAKGAARIASLIQHDAASGRLAEDEAGAWAAGWADKVREMA